MGRAALHAAAPQTICKPLALTPARPNRQLPWKQPPVPTFLSPKYGTRLRDGEVPGAQEAQQVDRPKQRGEVGGSWSLVDEVVQQLQGQGVGIGDGW